MSIKCRERDLALVAVLARDGAPSFGFFVPYPVRGFVERGQGREISGNKPFLFFAVHREKTALGAVFQREEGEIRRRGERSNNGTLRTMRSAKHAAQAGFPAKDSRVSCLRLTNFSMTASLFDSFWAVGDKLAIHPRSLGLAQEARKIFENSCDHRRPRACFMDCGNIGGDALDEIVLGRMRDPSVMLREVIRAPTLGRAPARSVGRP